MGWVEDHRGSPIAGAIVSLFGRGMGSRGIVAITDSAGRFVLQSLPPGSYTMRALGRGYRPAAARRIKILPDAASVFTLSLLPGERLTQQEEDARLRELQWLLRHKQRSVLEDQAPSVDRSDNPPLRADLFGSIAPFASAVGGSVDLLTNGASVGLGDDSTGLVTPSIPTNLSVVRLGGKFACGRWSIGGIVAERGTPDRDPTRWRMAATFVLRPLGKHQIEADAGFGTPVVQPFSVSVSDGFPYTRGIGVLSLRETWETGRISATLGTRYTYVGTLTASSYADPQAAVSFRAGEGTTLRATAHTRTVIPGGDPLALSGLSLGPTVALALVDPALRAERVARYEISVDHQVGSVVMGGHVFFESVKDPLQNSFSPGGGALRIANAGARMCQGFGLSFSRSFGRMFRSSVVYTYGRSWRDMDDPGIDPIVPGDFHDLVTQFETKLDRSGTRVSASYRLSALAPEAETVAPLFSSRFDVQLRQAIPFLPWLTRADWELLLAYRNLFFEPDEAATLDEAAVANSPRRVVGGVSVRF